MRSLAMPFAALAFAAGITAQLPDWRSLAVTPTRTFQEAHIAVVQTTTDVHAFSTYTRVWNALPVSANATFQGYDDHTLVLDAGTITAYASRFGTWVPLPGVSPAASAPAMAASSYLSYVVDGNVVHAFSPFLGTWATLTCQGSPTCAGGKMVLVVADSATAYGYSPLFGTFEPLTLPVVASPTVEARCYCGFATDNSLYFGFSTEHNTWSILNTAPGSTLMPSLARSGYLVLANGNDLEFFSGISGNSTHLTCLHAPVVNQGEQVCVVEDGNDRRLFSSVTDSIVTRTFASAPLTFVGNYYAMLQDGTAVHAFSAARGQFAPVLQGSTVVGSSINCAAAVDPNGVFRGYSPLQNVWVAGPTVAGGIARMTQGSFTVNDAAAGILHGFSVRHAAWNSTPAPGVESDYIFGSNFVARANNDLYVFNERWCRWSHAQTAAPATITMHQQTVLAEAGTQLLAYGHWNDRWSQDTAASVSTSRGVADDVALVRDSSGVRVFSATCQSTSLSLYPEWWRFQSRGTVCAFFLAGEAGTGAFLVANFLPTNLTVPGIGGVLGVEPTGAAVLFGFLPPRGAWRIPLTFPNDPGISGITIHTQGLVLGPQGPYFTGTYPTTLL